MADRIPITALQKAVYTRVAAKLATLTPVLPFYAYTPPRDADYPFVVLSQFAFAPDRTKTSTGQNATATIEVYHLSASATVLNNTVDGIIQDLSGTVLTLESDFTDIGLGVQEGVDTFASWDEAMSQQVLTAIIKFTWVIDDRS